MLRLVIIAALPLAFVPAPAFAANGAIGCIEAKIGPAAMQRIGEGVVAAADKEKDPSGALDADRDALIAARDACRTANSWSNDATQAAVSYLQARATKLGAESALHRDGLDVGKLSVSYAALPVQDRKSLIAKASPGAINAVTTATPRPAARRHVLLFFAALAAIEFYPAEFKTA
jgi:hypothetical protein